MRWVRPMMAGAVMLAAGPVCLLFAWTHRNAGPLVVFLALPAGFAAAAAVVWPRWLAVGLAVAAVYGFEAVVAAMPGRVMHPNLVQGLLDGKAHLLVFPVLVAGVGAAAVYLYRRADARWPERMEAVPGPMKIGYAAFWAAAAGLCVVSWRTPAAGSLADAIRAGSLRDVELLVARGADVNRGDRTGLTPLHHAAMSCPDVGVLKCLLSHGAEVNARDRGGRAPLHWAFSPAAVAALLEAGADVTVRDAAGLTPLHKAAATGRRDLCELLIERRADVRARSASGRTPLHESAAAAWADEDKVIDFAGAAELLIRKGAEVNAADKDGNTPLHLAAASGYVPLGRVLLAHAAGRTAVNAKGATPLAAALAAGHQDFARLLR